MKKLAKIAPFAAVGLTLLLLAALNLFWQDNWLDSDMAAEMIFSKLLAQEGHVFAAKDWYYSTEFRVLYTQLLMGPLFRLTGNWHLIRTVTNLVFYGLMLASYYYFVKPLKLSRTGALLTSILLLLPFSETMMTHMEMGNTYPSHVILCLLFFGMYLRLAEGSGLCPAYRLAVLVCFAALSFVMGLSGVRYLLALQAPLVPAALWYVTGCPEFKGFRKGMGRKEAGQLVSCGTFRYLGFSLFAAVSALAGYGANVLFVSRQYVFQTYEATNFIAVYDGIFFERVQNMLGSLLMLFGYIPDRGFLSLRGMVSLASFVLLGIFFFCGAKGMTQRRGMRRFVCQFLAVSFFLNIFVFVFTTSTMVPRYYLTIYIFALPTTAFYLESDHERLDKAALAVLLSACLLLGTAKTVLSFVTVDKNAQKRAVAAFLKDEGYSFGFATYTNGNIVTELTEGAVEIANIGNPEQLEFFRWSSPARYYEKGYHTGETFLLLTAEEMEQYREAASVQAGEKVYEDGAYTVLVYGSTEELLDLAEE